MAADAKQRLIHNIVGSLGQTPKRIQELQVKHFYEADPAYGSGIAKGLGLDIDALVQDKQATAAD
jgi:catalase